MKRRHIVLTPSVLFSCSYVPKKTFKNLERLICPFCTYYEKSFDKTFVTAERKTFVVVVAQTESFISPPCILVCVTKQLTFNPLNAKLNPICYLLALLGVHHFLHVSRIRVKSLTLRLLMSYIHTYIHTHTHTHTHIYIYIYMEHLFLMFLDHTQRRTTVGRTPLDE